MAGIRQHATTPELAVRKALRRLGIRYRTTNKDLPGSPDITNREQMWAIFVHGCFWHRHKGCSRTTTPSSNRAAWVKKFAENVARDRRRAAQLRRLGFVVLTIWECQSEDEELVRRRIARIAK